MYINRVEHIDTHEGPYRKENRLENMREMHGGSASHPGMVHEFVYGLLPDGEPNRDNPSYRVTWDNLHEYYCGFTSPEKAAEWFDGWIDELTEYAFILAVYECSGVIEGITQSIFRMDSATRVDEFPLSILL